VEVEVAGVTRGEAGRLELIVYTGVGAPGLAVAAPRVEQLAERRIELGERHGCVLSSRTGRIARPFPLIVVAQIIQIK
jgi:hypothetical protein